MKLSPRLLFSALPMFMRAPMKMKIAIGIAGAGFFGWTYFNKSKAGLGHTSDQQRAPIEQSHLSP